MKKLIAAILAAVLVLVLTAPVVLAKPDMNKPLHATDVEVVKKVTIQGKPGGGGKPAKQAATGVLGANVSGNKYAIIIGISDYPGEGNDLEYCDDDAQEMYNALAGLYGYKPSNIRLLKDLDASFTAIQHAINATRSQVADGDEVVFFFSGHGAKGKADDGDDEKIDEAIISHDGSQDGKLIAIWDGQLEEWFVSFQTSRIIFIFDSCLAGGMTDLQAPGRIINMACSEGGVSYEGEAWENGQFTYFFVDQGILGRGADRYDHDKDGVFPESTDVTIEEAFDYAKANCQMQKPAISDSFSNDLLL